MTTTDDGGLLDIGATDVAPPAPRHAHYALLAYRIMAYLTGTLLVVLAFVGLPLEYAAGQKWVGALWTAHGFLFIVYLITAVILGFVMRWKLTRLVLIGLCGTIPILTFVAERNTVKHARAAGVR